MNIQTTAYIQYTLTHAGYFRRKIIFDGKMKQQITHTLTKHAIRCSA